jgi:hypothetical protein
MGREDVDAELADLMPYVSSWPWLKYQGKRGRQGMGGKTSGEDEGKRVDEKG